MRLLFIHQNIPGQFQHLLHHYIQQPDCEVLGLGERQWFEENQQKLPSGLRVALYDAPAVGVEAETHPYLSTTNAMVFRGQQVVRALLAIRKDGYHPDLIYAHAGWGETLYVKDVFPRVPLVNYCEYYYQPSGGDFGFDPEFPRSMDHLLELRTRNMPLLVSLAAMDLGIAPMSWQRSRVPGPWQSRIEVVHDGIDTGLLHPDPEATFETPSGLRLGTRDEVITYVNRYLDPVRGFHVFMRALPELLERRPKAQVLIAGVSHIDERTGQGYFERMCKELEGQLDFGRIHFLGKIDHARFRSLLQVSTAHVYLTYPFVLSWSMLEAMACGCVVIGSRTAPVTEVIEDGHNGWLVDFFDHHGWIAAIERACQAREAMAAVRQAARQTVIERYDLQRVCLPRQTQLLERLVR